MTTINIDTLVKDGVDHINAYSRGKTTLGKFLSNFYPVEIIIDGKKFASVEGWWYWQSLNRQNITNIDHMCKLAKQPAKLTGKDFHIVRKLEVLSPEIEKLKEVYFLKINSNEAMKKLLAECTLPITHYYDYAGKRVQHYAWTGELWNEIRDELKNAN